jgi:hypothetical protein
MKVKCTSCGKVFDIPKAQDGKMLRCLCRSLFRAKAIEDDIQEIADIAQVSDPDETLETKRQRGRVIRFERNQRVRAYQRRTGAVF